MAEPHTYTQQLQATRQANTAAAQTKAHQDAILNALKASQNKPPFILTNELDLGNKISELKTQAVAAIKGLDSSESDKAQLAAIRTLSDGIASLERAVDRYETAIERQTVQLVSALNKLELSPRITVPEPKVTVKEATPVNLKPLEKAINGLKAGKTTNLSDYRAHDLDTAPDGNQYIGYIALDGSWYIIQSNENANTMRYYFGNGDYTTAWSEKHIHDYTTLSEAIRALAT